MKVKKSKDYLQWKKKSKDYLKCKYLRHTHGYEISKSEIYFT